MANATIDALYAGSLKLKISYISFLNNFTFYKWCVTKVAHCIEWTFSNCTKTHQVNLVERSVSFDSIKD